MALRMRRTAIMALVCLMVLSFQNILKSGGMIYIYDNATEGPPVINYLTNNTKKSRLEYIRSPGNEDGLLQIFEGIVRNDTKQHLPRTAKEIAEKYGIPVSDIVYAAMQYFVLPLFFISSLASYIFLIPYIIHNLTGNIQRYTLQYSSQNSNSWLDTK